VQRMWSEAAEQWASAQASAGKIAEVLAEVGEAERVLEKIGALELAWLGKWSAVGFTQRLERFSAAVESSGIEELLREVEAHELGRWSARERFWLERAGMAGRLARWLAVPASPAADWTESVAAYQREGAWVDWARQALMGGDEPEGPAGRWRVLCDRAAKRRDEDNRAFARHLAAATQQD